MIETETRTDKDTRWNKAQELFDSLTEEQQQDLKNAVVCDPVEWLMLIVE